jgi:hypothetical protein
MKDPIYYNIEHKNILLGINTRGVGLREKGPARWVDDEWEQLFIDAQNYIKKDDYKLLFEHYKMKDPLYYANKHKTILLDINTPGIGLTEDGTASWVDNEWAQLFIDVQNYMEQEEIDTWGVSNYRELFEKYKAKVPSFFNSKYKKILSGINTIGIGKMQTVFGPPEKRRTIFRNKEWEKLWNEVDECMVADNWDKEYRRLIPTLEHYRVSGVSQPDIDNAVKNGVNTFVKRSFMQTYRDVQEELDIRKRITDEQKNELIHRTVIYQEPIGYIPPEAILIKRPISKTRLSEPVNPWYNDNCHFVAAWDLKYINREDKLALEKEVNTVKTGRTILENVLMKERTPGSKLYVATISYLDVLRQLRKHLLNDTCTLLSYYRRYWVERDPISGDITAESPTQTASCNEEIQNGHSVVACKDSAGIVSIKDRALYPPHGTFPPTNYTFENFLQNEEYINDYRLYFEIPNPSYRGLGGDIKKAFSPRRRASSRVKKSPKRRASSTVKKSPKRRVSSTVKKSPKRRVSSTVKKSPKRRVSSSVKKSPRRTASTVKK